MGRFVWLFVPIVGLAGACVAASGAPARGEFESLSFEQDSNDVRRSQIALATPGEPAPAPGNSDAIESHAGIDDLGKQTFEQICSSCHAIELATGMRNSKRDWQRIVDRMYQFGMTASDEEAAVVVNYLAAKYPAE